MNEQITYDDHTQGLFSRWLISHCQRHLSGSPSVVSALSGLMFVASRSCRITICEVAAGSHRGARRNECANAVNP